MKQQVAKKLLVLSATMTGSISFGRIRSPTHEESKLMCYTALHT